MDGGELTLRRKCAEVDPVARRLREGLTRKYRCLREIDESGEKWQLSLVHIWFVVGESERMYLDVSRTNVVQYLLTGI